MNNQEVFIVVLIIVLLIMSMTKCYEGFESNPNYYPCDTHPNNSNCTCALGTKPIVDGPYPKNYGQTAPYKYDCVSNYVQEPDTNVWPNPPE